MKKLGLSRFDNQQQIQQYSKQLGQSLYIQQKQELEEQLAVFKSVLLNFVSEHNNELLQDDKVRYEFIRICRSVGIDPLAIYSLSANVGGSNSRINEFYYTLCVRLIEYTNATKSYNGGLVAVDDLLAYLSRQLPLSITLKDLEVATQQLSIMNTDLKIIEISHKLYIKNTSVDLTLDQLQVLEIASNIGFVTVEMLKDNCHWSTLKSEELLNLMITNGYFWLDVFKGQKMYWDPSWITKV